MTAKNKHDIGKIKILIKYVKTLNYCNYKYIPVEYPYPLLAARMNKNYQISDKIIKLLINNGADPNYKYIPIWKNEDIVFRRVHLDIDFH